MIQRITALLISSFFVLSNAIVLARESTIEGRAMGMTFRVVLVDPLEDSQLADVRRSILEILDIAESTFSLYRVDSEIALWNTNQSTDWIPASDAFISLVEHSRELSQTTQGAFDPTVRPLSKLWRFDKVDAHWMPPTETQLAEAFQLVGIHWVQLRYVPPGLKKELPGVELDLNALVEGWCLDRIVELLEASGRSNFLVHLGGEYAARGRNTRNVPWSITIESPSITRVDEASEPTAEIVVDLLDECISTSGTYRSGHVHQGKWYGHILDARTGYPFPADRLSSSVVAKSASTADGMATAMLTMDVESAMKICDELGLAALVTADSNGGLRHIVSKAGEVRFRRKETASFSATISGLTSPKQISLGICLVAMVAIVAAVAIVWAKRRVVDSV